MKVFVVTRTEAMMPEIYVGVTSTRKKAEHMIYKQHPHAVKVNHNTSTYTSFNVGGELIFIREEEI